MNLKKQTNKQTKEIIYFLFLFLNSFIIHLFITSFIVPSFFH